VGEVVGTALIFFWELSLRLWLTFKGFNSSALFWPRLLLSGESGHLMSKIANAAFFVLRAVVLCPRRASDVPPNSRNWPSLAVASRGQRSRLQHWTAPIIGNHPILDPLVMRRSSVRFR